MSNRFSVELTKNPKQKPDPDSLRFGTVFTDHMFVMDYDPENGWHDGKIVPYGPWHLTLQQWFSITDRKCSRVLRPTRPKRARFSFSDLI